MNVSIINAKIITGFGFFLLNISKIKYPTKLQKIKHSGIVTPASLKILLL